jgi:APA family basic amino acid/polyamine antiporter
MSRDGDLPRFLAAVHPRYAVPHRAEPAVGLVVAVLAAFLDFRAAIGFSSFAVLLKGKVRAALGLAGCVVLAFSLPLPSVLAGGAASVPGASAYGVRRVRRWEITQPPESSEESRLSRSAATWCSRGAALGNGLHCGHWKD